MNGDVGIIKEHVLAFVFKGEVVLVDGGLFAVTEVHFPIHPFDVYNVNVVLVFIKERVQAPRRAQRHFVFRRVATAYDGNISLQIFHILIFLFFFKFS